MYIFLHQILHIDIYTIIIVLQRCDYVAINIIWRIGVTNNYRIVHGHHLYSIVLFDAKHVLGLNNSMDYFKQSERAMRIYNSSNYTHNLNFSVKGRYLSYYYLNNVYYYLIIFLSYKNFTR